jgi:hypothetical protein
MKRAKQAGLMCLVAAGLVLAAGTGARADDLSPAVPAFARADVMPASSEFGSEAKADDLSKERAGFFDTNQVILTNQKQDAKTEDNKFYGPVKSGNVIIGQGAINSSGVNQVVANSGAAGIAQGGITMNIIVNP